MVSATGGPPRALIIMSMVVKVKEKPHRPFVTALIWSKMLWTWSSRTGPAGRQRKGQARGDKKLFHVQHHLFHQ